MDELYNNYRIEPEQDHAYTFLGDTLVKDCTGPCVVGIAMIEGGLYRYVHADYNQRTELSHLAKMSSNGLVAFLKGEIEGSIEDLYLKATKIDLKTIKTQTYNKK